MATTTENIPSTQADVDALNSLLRGEISSVETYDQAIDKFKEPEHRNISNVLTRIRDEHNRSVTVLRERVLAHGGKPSEGAGVWGVFANLVEGTAKLLGPQTALAALKQGELYGKEQYEKTVEKTDVTTECRFLIRNDLMPKCQQHITTLDQLMAQLEAKQ
jgi:uncharacterized protein (TIGR02284 family)